MFLELEHYNHPNMLLVKEGTILTYLDCGPTSSWEPQRTNALPMPTLPFYESRRLLPLVASELTSKRTCDKVVL